MNNWYHLPIYKLFYPGCELIKYYPPLYCGLTLTPYLKVRDKWSTRPTHYHVGSDHFFRTWCPYFPSVRPSVRPHYSKLRKTKQFSSENNDRFWRDCGYDQVDHWWHLSSCNLFLTASHVLFCESYDHHRLLGICICYENLSIIKLAIFSMDKYTLCSIFWYQLCFYKSTPKEIWIKISVSYSFLFSSVCFIFHIFKDQQSSHNNNKAYKQIIW